MEACEKRSPGFIKKLTVVYTAAYVDYVVVLCGIWQTCSQKFISVQTEVLCSLASYSSYRLHILHMAAYLCWQKKKIFYTMLIFTVTGHHLLSWILMFLFVNHSQVHLHKKICYSPTHKKTNLDSVLHKLNCGVTALLYIH